MRKLHRDEVVDYATWADEVRQSVASDVMAAKAARRVHIAPFLTFLFENALTVRWQVQEMMRVERIVKEAAIQHEIDTYNGLLGDAGELGVTLLIEIPDKAERDRLLPRWHGLLEVLYAEIDDGSRVRPSFDPAQVGQERLSSVQYLRFDTGGRVPVAIGSEFDAHPGRAELSAQTRAALAGDLESA